MARVRFPNGTVSHEQVEAGLWYVAISPPVAEVAAAVFAQRAEHYSSSGQPEHAAVAARLAERYRTDQGSKAWEVWQGGRAGFEQDDAMSIATMLMPLYNDLGQAVVVLQGEEA